MFWRKKTQGLKEHINRLDKKIQKLSENFVDLGREMKGAFREQKQDASSVEAQLAGLRQEIEEYGKQLRIQSQSVEDLLDEISEQQEQQDSILKEKNLAMEERQEQKKREEELVALAVLEREQLGLLEKMVLEAAASDEQAKKGWETQFRLMEEEARRAMASCAMEETGAVGEKVDYLLHDVKKTVDTEEKDKDGIIIEVYSPGRFYHGRLLKKADVAVYRFRGGEEGQSAKIQ